MAADFGHAEDREALRESLIIYVKRKFFSISGIASTAEDIVDEAWLSLLGSRSYTPEKENFGYLSTACVRIAYRMFLREGRTAAFDFSEVVSQDDFVEEIMESADAEAVIASLSVLRDIERIVVTERYFNEHTFAEIAGKHGIKLNTVLSHHRRALDKLRKRLMSLMGDEVLHYGGR